MHVTQHINNTKIPVVWQLANGFISLAGYVYVSGKQGVANHNCQHWAQRLVI